MNCVRNQKNALHGKVDKIYHKKLLPSDRKWPSEIAHWKLYLYE